MKKEKRFLWFPLAATLTLISCGGEKPSDNHPDTLHDTLITTNTEDSVHYLFKRMVATLPVPFEIMKKFEGANLPFNGSVLCNPDNAGKFNSASAQAINLGVFGADMSYLISQNHLGESAPYLKGVRKLSDNIVVPSAFDEGLIGRYESNMSQKDSLQRLMHTSYKRIDSTLQENDRLALASLVLAGGWLESIYITTQHIAEQQQNEKNKVLYDMLAIQNPYVTRLSDLLGRFTSDSLCISLHRDMEDLKKVTPPGPDIPPDQFANQLTMFRTKIADIRNKYVRVQ
ncbi:MAG TPA: hypothetical protein VFU15_03305 [Bacteroidia bacterium]|nr:hypothetical protein [Bacteroidia bacterium]